MPRGRQGARQCPGPTVPVPSLSPRGIFPFPKPPDASRGAFSTDGAVPWCCHGNSAGSSSSPQPPGLPAYRRQMGTGRFGDFFLVGEQKESSGPGAGSRWLRPGARGEAAPGARHHQGTLGWKQQAMFSTHTHLPAWFRHPPPFNAHGLPCRGALGTLQVLCKGLQPGWDPPAASLVPEP